MEGPDLRSKQVLGNYLLLLYFFIFVQAKMGNGWARKNCDVMQLENTYCLKQHSTGIHNIYASMGVFQMKWELWSRLLQAATHYADQEVETANLHLAQSISRRCIYGHSLETGQLGSSLVQLYLALSEYQNKVQSLAFPGSWELLFIVVLDWKNDNGVSVLIIQAAALLLIPQSHRNGGVKHLKWALPMF